MSNWSSLNELREGTLTHFIVGAFIYRDMSCSLLVEPTEQIAINTPSMYSYITKHIPSSVHPITWLHTEVFYLLSALCRYIRGIVDGGEHDIILEATFEQELLNWRADQCDPLWEKTTDAFCRHGLILLYRLCGRSSRLASSLIPSGMDGDAWRIQGSLDTNTVIRRHTINVLYSLLSIPISSPQSAVQSIPFLTAGGELVQPQRWCAI